MYIVVVYDVKKERVSKVLKTARKYLSWIQNSVLEGSITPGKLAMLKKEIKKIIEPNEDSFRIYELESEMYFQCKELGKGKGTTSQYLI